ncbi:monovalent cation/H+ antiporter subunit D [Pseudothauera nasutitermitis]|uniref:Monovalent cation/H+ antiporter subunit D n=1 Tax=Pseudothauera nasutitermitis TaxID=2565930 RepID=A0A4S4AQ64_9RHOO|nr:monovalent cation/H+ antiporter subunit D [Pseudothauera nasutitermitis]THF61876.1 monovalent cation/H+ antiporter subunit D [Pseudothauera nasutitermitis]
MSPSSWLHHLILVPVLLPLLCGALLIPVNETRHRFKYAVNLFSVLGLLATAVALIWLADNGAWDAGIGVYLAANWAAPFGIALMVDRLAALMLLLTAVLAFAALLYSTQRWSRIGVHFHSLFQFLLMGINGAFLTHDLFNLFVFFEVMLAASYGLLLHGYNATRIRAGLQYITINLAASLFFLIGVALIYASAGTLNMADLAARMPAIAGTDLVLLKAGVAILALAFLVKSAMWPLGFWLPTTYSAASPPVAAMLVLMTKVGAYAILRLWLLVFSDGAGEAAGFGYQALLWAGMVTIVFGAAGMMASEELGRLAGYGAIVSSGTLLAVVGYGQPSLVTAGLYYLLGSTMAMAAFMLLIELIERIRSPGAALLALTMEAFAIEETPDEPVGVGIPGALAFLGLAFAGCALIIAGLPPLSGFVAKFGLFHALLNPLGGDAAVHSSAWFMMGVILFAGFAAVLAMMRFGVRTFWASGAVMPPRLQATEVLPVALLLVLCVSLTVGAGPMFGYLERASTDLHSTPRYVDGVLSAPVVPGVVGTEDAR